jgi:hypothetical protein
MTNKFKVFAKVVCSDLLAYDLVYRQEDETGKMKKIRMACKNEETANNLSAYLNNAIKSKKIVNVEID